MARVPAAFVVTFNVAFQAPSELMAGGPVPRRRDEMGDITRTMRAIGITPGTSPEQSLENAETAIRRLVSISRRTYGQESNMTIQAAERIKAWLASQPWVRNIRKRIAAINKMTQVLRRQPWLASMQEQLVAIFRKYAPYLPKRDMTDTVLRDSIMSQVELESIAGEGGATGMKVVLKVFPTVDYAQYLAGAVKRPREGFISTFPCCYGTGGNTAAFKTRIPIVPRTYPMENLRKQRIRFGNLDTSFRVAGINPGGSGVRLRSSLDRSDKHRGEQAIAFNTQFDKPEWMKEAAIEAKYYIEKTMKRYVMAVKEAFEASMATEGQAAEAIMDGFTDRIGPAFVGQNVSMMRMPEQNAMYQPVGPFRYYPGSGEGDPGSRNYADHSYNQENLRKGTRRRHLL